MDFVNVEHRDDVCVIWLNRPPVNAINAALRTELASALETAQNDAMIKGIVLASRLAKFTAGADIKEFSQPVDGISLRDVIAMIDASSKPVVAAVDGIALGGGTEIMLACDARIVTTAARLGLPEVKIGLLPGAGGTQRLPRLIDPARALAFMAKGDPVTGEQAVEQGMADFLVAGDELISAAATHATKLAETGTLRKVSAALVSSDTRDSFESAAVSLAKSHSGEPQIEAVISAARDVYDQPFEEGLRREREHFVRLMNSDRSKSLRYAFLAERAVGQSASSAVPTREIAGVGVIGGGTMGGGIAMAFASKGVPVVLVETDRAAADRAFERITANYAHSVKRGSITEAVRDGNLSRIAPAVDYSRLAKVDLVIEAAFEEMDVKRQIFRDLVAATKPTAILATNTSYLDVDKIAEASGVPERVLGMHFFSPANIMKLVEVVRGAHSAPETVATVVKTARMLGKIPVVVGNCHGFVGNRILYRRSDQLDRLLLEGASPEQIDEAFTGFGSKLGPCAMGDLAGLDISWRMRRAMGRAAPVADALVEAGRLGQKTRKGYYAYDETGRSPSHDPEVAEIIETVSKACGVERREIGCEEIVDRLILPMVNEGARILEEGIVERASDIDLIWLHGYGFPRWRGGPMFYAQTRGLREVAARLEELATLTGDASMNPASLLVKLAVQDATLTSPVYTCR
ncbi:MAG TPA: 3-hydroxyacyl-CoA dehydrogenase NAD-binding domain-containing protein [Rhizobiaceae bacterium]|nr:3-hydroxyacyl-CoA dehydrogenase NAD-binding domain-containing protein [Rhizobiaceae bacterium]